MESMSSRRRNNVSCNLSHFHTTFYCYLNGPLCLSMICAGIKIALDSENHSSSQEAATEVLFLHCVPGESLG